MAALSALCTTRRIVSSSIRHAQVQASVRLFFFETFQRIGVLFWQWSRSSMRKGLLFPRRLRSGVHKGELVWAELLHCRARQIIHNPRYAGAFVFGRTKQRHLPNGKVCSRLVPSEEWIFVARHASRLHCLGGVPIEPPV